MSFCAVILTIYCNLSVDFLGIFAAQKTTSSDELKKPVGREGKRLQANVTHLDSSVAKALCP